MSGDEHTDSAVIGSDDSLELCYSLDRGRILRPNLGEMGALEVELEEQMMRESSG